MLPYEINKHYIYFKSSLGKLWESRKWIKGEAVCKSDREGNINVSYFNGIKKLNQRNENESKKWNGDTEQFYVHTLNKEY